MSKTPSTTPPPESGSNEGDEPTYDHHRPKRTVGLWSMFILTFLATSAGPFGIESAIESGGAYVTLGFVLLVPVFFVLPMILMVWELSAWMPTNHGSVRWVERAYGPQFGFVNGVFVLVTNAIDISVYPVMAVNYLTAAFWPNPPWWGHALIVVGIVLAGGVPCLFPIKEAVIVSVITVALILSPFAVGFVAGCTDIEPSTWPPTPEKVNYANLLAMGVWLYIGFMGNGSLAGEVTSSRAFLGGQLIAVVLDISMYVLPLAVALQAPGPWKAGYLVPAFDHILDHLGQVVGVAGGLSALGLYMSSMLVYSRAMWGAADMGWLPQFVRKRSDAGVPQFTVLFHMLVSVVMAQLPFNFLVQLEGVISSCAFLLFATAFISLRYMEPHAHRPCLVPGGQFSTWLVPLPMTLIMFGILGSNLVDWRLVVGLVATIVIAVVLYFAVVRRQQHHAVEESTFSPEVSPVDIPFITGDEEGQQMPGEKSCCDVDNSDEIELVSMSGSNSLQSESAAPSVRYE